MRVLVVEDDRKVAGFIRTGLEQEGYAVDVLTDGSDAGEQAQDGRLRRGRARPDAARPIRASRCCATSARASRRCRC